jgi:hypothetical protein
MRFCDYKGRILSIMLNIRRENSATIYFPYIEDQDVGRQKNFATFFCGF